MFQKLANSEGVGLQGLDDLTWNDPKACLSSIGLNGLGSLIIISLPAEPVTLLYNPIILSLKVLNALLAPSLIGF